MATVKVFDKLGIPIEITKVMDEGRALQSQGMLDDAKVKAKNVASYLGKLVDAGKKIIVAEPSVLAMVRRDFKKLIENDELFEKLKTNTYDPVEYLNYLFSKKDVEVKETIRIPETVSKKIFLHNQCQMKTIGAGEKNREFLEKIGFEVTSSTVECCGMAGSFGYKKEYYDLSKNVGSDLTNQIADVENTNGTQQILASGTSCRAQINDGMDGRKVIHPIQFIENIV